jgi:hypothetical protein
MGEILRSILQIVFESAFMAANLAANHADPEFEARRERIRAEAARKVIKERKLREGKD